MSLAAFFSPRAGSVVVVGEEDRMILDCYRLARFYHISPKIFLAMTFSEVRLHVLRTGQIVREQRAASEEDE
jgi:hypothetical protein